MSRIDKVFIGLLFGISMRLESANGVISFVVLGRGMMSIVPRLTGAPWHIPATEKGDLDSYFS